MEFVAMVVGSAVSVSCAFYAVTLYRGTIDTSLEFIAVLSSGARAVGVAGAIRDRSSGSGGTINASLEFIAVLTSWARAIRIACTIGDGASRSRCTINATLKLIAVLSCWA